MIEVTIEVSSRVNRFELLVRAESIQRAVSIAKDFYPAAEARVLYPIEPETFFVKNHAAAAGPVRLEILESAAG